MSGHIPRDGSLQSPFGTGQAGDYNLDIFFVGVFNEICRRAQITDPTFLIKVSDNSDRVISSDEVEALFIEYARALLDLYNIGTRFEFRRKPGESFVGDCSRNLLNLSTMIDNKSSSIFTYHRGMIKPIIINWQAYGHRSRHPHRFVLRRKLLALLSGFETHLSEGDIITTVEYYRTMVIPWLMGELCFGRINDDWQQILADLIKKGYRVEEEGAYEWHSEMVDYPDVYWVLTAMIQRFPDMGWREANLLKKFLMSEQEMADSLGIISDNIREELLFEAALNWLRDHGYSIKDGTASN